VKQLKARLWPAAFLLFISTTAPAQRLIIESPSQGPITKIIYGKLTEKSVYIFEREFPLSRSDSRPENINNATEQKPEPAPDTPTGQTAAEEGLRRTVLMSFTIPEAELNRCMSSPRFIAFKNLALVLKNKINNIVINTGSDSAECSEKIAAVLIKAFSGINVSTENYSGNDIKIDLGVVSVSKPTKEPDIAKAEEPKQILSLTDLLKFTKISIGDQKIIPDKTGWFVAEISDQVQYQVDVTVTGFNPVSTTVFPVLLSTDAAAVSKGNGYYARSAEFNKPMLKIKINETPYLAKKTTLDGGLGGGYGFGREVPGEKKGQRTVASLGLERREWHDAFGYRAGVFYSRAPATVVPSTYTIRVSGFYDGEILQDYLFARVGAGLELFHAKLTQPQKKIITESDVPTANIPQKVLSPMLTFSMHTILFDTVMISPSLVVTPLYIASIGLYTSTSPGLELSAKVFKIWIAALQFGTEVHRYPSQLGETRLQLDYGLLTLKKGVF